MTSSYVKVIARESERELVESCVEEFHAFVVEGKRPDFDDKTVICVRFIICDYSDLELAEGTSWFINPIYLKDKYELRQAIADNSDLRYCDYLDKMASEFLPELLLLPERVKDRSIFELYENFYHALMMEDETDLPDDIKFERFLNFIEEFEE